MTLLPVYFGAAWLLPQHPAIWTVLAFYLTRSLVYEWTHYIVHTPYRPKTELYRHLWRHHRLHHYKNENYWYGVSVTAADKWLHTAPPIADVETSPTARNLHAHV